MRTILRLTALAILSTALPLLASAGANAAGERVNYVSQTKTGVTVNYYDMPAGTALSFVSWISGAKFVPLMPMVSGTGTMTLPFTPLPDGPGSYYVLAEQAGDYQGQTVVFIAVKPDP